MLTLPVSASTFKKAFLQGAGNLEISTDQDAWAILFNSGGCFTSDVDRVADVLFSLSTGSNFQFGIPNGMKLGISGWLDAHHQIELIWPGQESDVLKAYGLEKLLTSGNLYLRLLLTAKGDASAKGSFPTGPLSATFGIGAGGTVLYERLKMYPASEPAREALADLFASLRLPQQINSPTEIPAPGEVLCTRLGSYLNLSADVCWGYSLTGSKSVALNELNLDLDYALRLAASLNIGYRLAGDLAIETSRGTDPGWVRFVARKNRDSEFNLVADFGADANLDLKGLPESADDFLSKLIGADAQQILGYFNQAKQYSSVEELEKAAGKMAKGTIHTLAQKWMGKTLDNSTLRDFLDIMGQVADAYNRADQRIIHIYQEHLDRIPQLKAILSILSGTSSRADLQALSGKPETWDFVSKIWNEHLYSLLLEDDEFARFSQFIKQMKGFVEHGAVQYLRDYLAQIKQSFPLNSLFEHLRGVKTADDFKNLGDERLQELAGRLIGREFEKIKESEFGEALVKLHNTLRKIEDFKNLWQQRLQQAIHQSFQSRVQYAWSRASGGQRLLDVEINLNEPAGAILAARAAGGDFSEVVSKFDPRMIRINQGVFTTELSRSAHLQINLLGWGYDSLSQLIQNSREAIETASGGLIHLYSSETTLRQRKQSGRRFKELLESNFILRTLGESFQPAMGTSSGTDSKTREYLITSLRNLTVEYNLLENDQKTQPEELSRYLDLAEFLGLLTPESHAVLIRDLHQQLPGGLGEVSVRYVVRYDPAALLTAFHNLSKNDLRVLALSTMRELIAAKYIGMKQPNWLGREGFAYLSRDLHDLYDREGPAALSLLRSVTLPAWYTKGAPLQVALSVFDIAQLRTLCNLEKDFADRLVEMDDLLDKVILEKQPLSQLEWLKVAKQFEQLAPAIDDYRENAFFAIFDKLIEQGSRSKVARASVMVLEISPAAGEKIVKFLSSPVTGEAQTSTADSAPRELTTLARTAAGRS
jgi:hypothetical protein